MISRLSDERTSSSSEEVLAAALHTQPSSGRPPSGMMFFFRYSFGPRTGRDQPEDRFRVHVVGKRWGVLGHWLVGIWHGGDFVLDFRDQITLAAGLRDDVEVFRVEGEFAAAERHLEELEVETERTRGPFFPV